MLHAIAAALLFQHPSSARFELAYPIGGAPIYADAYLSGLGLAQQTARAHNLQGRVLWIDGTANLERVSSDDKIESLMARVARVGFNTVVFDVKPIVGYTLYPSQYTEKLQEWKGQRLPKDFDPLASMVKWAHKNNLSLLASMNAFSEGHSLFKQGPGYQHPEWQTTLYDATPTLVLQGAEIDVESELNPKQLGDRVAQYTDSTKVPSGHKLFAVTADANGKIIDGYEDAGKDPKVPSIPKNGSLWVGSGPSATFLREHAVPGRPLQIGSRASFVKIADKVEQYPLMTNPNDPDVQDRAIGFVQEILSKYEVNGLLFDDRLRFGGMNADFGEASRAAFQRYVGKILKWPDDVFSFTFTKRLAKGIKPGRYYGAWLEWRTAQMASFVQRVRSTVDQSKPGAKFGIYAGSWYGDYPAIGSNYAADNSLPGFWFSTPRYRKTGFAGNLDLLITGCYYPTATISEAMEAAKPIGTTVEAAGQMTNRLVRDQCWSYAGISLDQFKGNPEGLHRALAAACESTQGVMVFDLSHDIDAMWPVFREAFSKRKKPPHETDELVTVRRKRKAYDKLGVRDNPIVIYGGSSGVGF